MPVDFNNRLVLLTPFQNGPDSKFHLTIIVSDYLSDESDETFIVWLPSGDAFSRISGSYVKTYVSSVFAVIFHFER